jgi:hypothetical protein
MFVLKYLKKYMLIRFPRRFAEVLCTNEASRASSEKGFSKRDSFFYLCASHSWSTTCLALLPARRQTHMPEPGTQVNDNNGGHSSQNM